MALSNYELMRNRMRSEFIKYNQENMIKKFGLKSDQDFLYIHFVGREYRIGRRNGIVEWSEDGFFSAAEADYNESMTIYDVLCYSADACHLSGNFCPLYAAKGTAKTLGPGGSLFQQTADSFQGKMEALKKACACLGEPAGMSGDVSVTIPAFPFLPVIFQFWEADEEFPAALKFMFDENILDYMHYETVYFMMGHILSRLEALVEAPA